MVRPTSSTPKNSSSEASLRRPAVSVEMDKNKTQVPKEKEKSYIVWTNEMDYALSASLLEQLHLGNKGSNGWKGVAFTAAISALWDECRVHISKEKIAARLKTWNKYYQEISAMLDTSGFGWDWERHVVQVDSEQVWADYIKAHPSLKHYKDKVIVNWGDLGTLCGTDRANGANTSTGVESSNDFGVEEIPEEEFPSEQSGQMKKKSKTPTAIDTIAEAVTYIAKNMDNPIEIAPIGKPSRSRIEAVYKALSVMTDLSEDDLIKAIDLLSVDATKCEVFLVLPEIARRRWLHIHISE
ncbi:hypothetical protein KSP39_PZI023020 [Platanthera zijinensis]|uniref:Myb/SANT-like domain-containing protein n=1 Tax=Platanthera zijinensis TaxID=2320716 RepID=A0AAP0AVZ8_9ASPA